MKNNKINFKQNIFRLTSIGLTALVLYPSTVSASLVTTFKDDQSYINRNVEASTREMTNKIYSTTAEKELTDSILKEAGRRDAEIEAREYKKALEEQAKKELEQELIKKRQEEERIRLQNERNRQLSISNSYLNLGSGEPTYNTSSGNIKTGKSVGRTTVQKDLNTIYDIVSKQKDNLTQDQINVVKNLPKYLGKNYVWGATGPNGYDCSGFTQSIMRDVGYNIVRVSGDQYRSNSLKIPVEDLSLGDLVFFQNTGSRSGITHVGMYIGDGIMVHASSSYDAIKTENVFNSYFANKYVGAVRYIK